MKRHFTCAVGLACCLILVLGCEKILDDPPPENAQLIGSQDGGFVWKPISESDGNLVILLPSSFAGSVDSVSVRQGGATIESGNFVGNTNGGRPTFRFSRPGAGYGNDLTVVASLTGGGDTTWSIPFGRTRVG